MALVKIAAFRGFPRISTVHGTLLPEPPYHLQDLPGKPMPRYFFYIVKDGREIADHEGDEFLDLEEAKTEAVASAKDVARQDIADNRSLKDACIEIRDESGAVLAAIELHEVLDSPDRPQFGDHCHSSGKHRDLH
jgi:hypothetical protein